MRPRGVPRGNSAFQSPLRRFFYLDYEQTKVLVVEVEEFQSPLRRFFYLDTRPAKAGRLRP